ncbi:MAG: DMT family transporter [Desulfobacterales bacterium]|nr:MAG: DMT family transporter [Desulfobacterales bacterium]
MDRLIGVLLVALSAACFGTNAIFARMAYDTGTNPGTFLFIRFLIASPVMLIIMMARGRTIPRGKLLISLVLIGGIGLAGTTFCFYTAIQLAPVNLVIVIAYMYPTIVTLLSAAFLRQPITSYKIAALLMTFVGILFIIGLDSGGYFLGIILAIIAAIFYSLYLIFGSLSIQRAGPFSASTVIILSSMAIFGIVVGVQGPQLPAAVSGWVAIVASALISTVLGLVVFFAGLKRIDTANAAIISTLEVVVAVALAIVILGETISWPKIIGGCLIISAVVLLAKSEHEAVQAKISQPLAP